MFKSCFALIALSSLVHLSAGVPQSAIPTAAPELSGAPASTATGNCGGCYIIADVAGIVFYSEIITQTVATAFVSVGGNGSLRTTTTQVIENQGEFTFSPTGPVATAGVGVQVNPATSVITVGGALLTSPTAYDVFSAYSITSEVLSDGSCVTISGTRNVLASAVQIPVPSGAAGAQFGLSAEQSFIDIIGFSTCLAGGENATPTVHVQSANLTVTSTVSNVAQIPTALGALTTESSSSSSSPSSSSSSSSAAPSSGLSSSLTPTSSSPLTTTTSVSKVVVVGNTTLPSSTPALELIIGSSTFEPLSPGGGITVGGTVLSVGTATFPANGTFSLGGATAFSGNVAGTYRQDLATSWVLWGAGLLTAILTMIGL